MMQVKKSEMNGYCYFLIKGVENYVNQMKFGKKTFAELEDINQNGFKFHGIHHEIDVVSCSDWKAAACIEGKSKFTE